MKLRGARGEDEEEGSGEETSRRKGDFRRPAISDERGFRQRGREQQGRVYLSGDGDSPANSTPTKLQHPITSPATPTSGGSPSAAHEVTFSKRRRGLLKKATELGVLCDAQIGLIVFSSSGKMFECCSPGSSLRQVIVRYQKHSGHRPQEIDNQQIFCEITRMRNENDKLQASMRQYTGEDLPSLSMADLHQLEQQLEASVNKVRTRKNQLLQQQLENLRKKEHLLEDQNSCLYRMLQEHQAAAMEHKVEAQMLDHFGAYYDEQARNILQLSPQNLQHQLRLQPTQPNLQDLQRLQF